jgi:HlyD family secretion protein
MKHLIRLLVLLVLLALLGGAGYGGWRWFQRKGAEAPAWMTQAVERGDLRQVVHATGTVNAVTSVTVGSQVSGIIQRLHVDYNSVVKAGQVIAELDPSTFKAKQVQAQATLRNNRAAVTSAEASLEEAGVRVRRQELNRDEEKRKLKRSLDLAEKGLISPQDKDAAQYAVDSAEASVGEAKAQESSARAGVERAKAQVEQAEAAVESARLDLDHTVIHSPIDGVVISRDVQVGQTVAASFQSPTLFTIAQDLREMQVEANVDEADIGVVREGVSAQFTVDAFPGESFTGKVAQVRLSPINVQNVITYITVIRVDNLEQKLRPGMTAVVTLKVAERKDVIRVPAAALRFRPDQGAGGAAAPPGAARGPATTAAPAAGGPGNGDGSAHPSRPPGDARTVWRLDPSGAPAPVPIVVGLTDGSYYELVRGELTEGDQVVTGQAARAAGSSPPLQSPFSSPRGMGGPRRRP